MEHFEFKNSHTLTEDEYEDIHRIYSKKQKTYRKILLVVAAIACYFSTYTILLGFILTGLLLLVTVSKKTARYFRGHRFKESKILSKELTYGLDETHLTIEGHGVFVRIRWNMIRVWQLHDRWLRIAADQFPAFYFDIEKLKEKDLLNRVLSLCEKHGIMFDSKESKERPSQSAHTTSANAPR